MNAKTSIISCQNCSYQQIVKNTSNENIMVTCRRCGYMWSVYIFNKNDGVPSFKDTLNAVKFNTSKKTTFNANESKHFNINKSLDSLSKTVNNDKLSNIKENNGLTDIKPSDRIYANQTENKFGSTHSQSFNINNNQFTSNNLQFQNNNKDNNSFQSSVRSVKVENNENISNIQSNVPPLNHPQNLVKNQFTTSYAPNNNKEFNSAYKIDATNHNADVKQGIAINKYKEFNSVYKIDDKNHNVDVNQGIVINKHKEAFLSKTQQHLEIKPNIPDSQLNNARANPQNNYNDTPISPMRLQQPAENNSVKPVSYQEQAYYGHNSNRQLSNNTNNPQNNYNDTTVSPMHLQQQTENTSVKPVSYQEQAYYGHNSNNQLSNNTNNPSMVAKDIKPPKSFTIEDNLSLSKNESKQPNEYINSPSANTNTKIIKLSIEDNIKLTPILNIKEDTEAKSYLKKDITNEQKPKVKPEIEKKNIVSQSREDLNLDNLKKVFAGESINKPLFNYKTNQSNEEKPIDHTKLVKQNSEVKDKSKNQLHRSIPKYDSNQENLKSYKQISENDFVVKDELTVATKKSPPKEIDIILRESLNQAHIPKNADLKRMQNNEPSTYVELNKKLLSKYKNDRINQINNIKDYQKVLIEKLQENESGVLKNKGNKNKLRKFNDDTFKKISKLSYEDILLIIKDKFFSFKHKKDYMKFAFYCTLFAIVLVGAILSNHSLTNQSPPVSQKPINSIQIIDENAGNPMGKTEQSKEEEESKSNDIAQGKSSRIIQKDSRTYIEEEIDIKNIMSVDAKKFNPEYLHSKAINNNIPEIKPDNTIEKIKGTFRNIYYQSKQKSYNIFNHLKITNSSAQWKYNLAEKTFETIITIQNTDSRHFYRIEQLELIFTDSTGITIDKRIVSPNQIIENQQSINIKIRTPDVPFQTAQSHVFILKQRVVG